MLLFVAMMREYVALLRECLSGESVTFEGDFFQLKRFRLGVRLGERRPKIGKAIRQAVTIFWENFRAGRRPNPDYDQDLETMRRVFTRAEGEVDMTEDVRLTAFQDLYVRGLALEKEAKGMKERAKAMMLEHIGDAEKVIGYGGKIFAETKPAEPERTVQTVVEAKPERRRMAFYPSKFFKEEVMEGVENG